MTNKQVVLIVEDEPLAKNALVFELEDAGFEVVTAENGEEASYLLPKMRQIDLLLTDIRMPGSINGWVLADIARRWRPSLPVIYTSGYTPQQGMEVEDSIFLQKPYRVSEILNAIEELKSGSEKLSSINEDLKVANEKLETSREELLLLNEELRSANAALSARVDELSRANDTLAHFLDGARIAAILLDRKFTIKRFTAAAKDLFCLGDGDVGRPISQIGSRLRLDSVQESAERVLRTRAAYEKQIESEDGAARYMMRILPYRTRQNVIVGVVVNFIDVTLIAAAEAALLGLTRELRNRVEKMERIIDLAPAGIFIVGNDPMQHVQVNRYGVRLLGENDGREGPRDVPVPYRLFDRDRELAFWEQPLQRAAVTGKPVPARPGRLVRWDGSSVEVIMSAEPILDESGAPLGAIAAIVDISERQEAETPADIPLASE